MTDQSIFGYPQEAPHQPAIPVEPGPFPPAAEGRPLQGPYKFSTDELRVMGECNRESFYQRSLPLSTTFGVGTYVALQKGYFRPNPRFGALPKMSFAVLVGYFVGKLSYQQACAEKLMALPGSYIGQLLRERRDGRAGSAMKQAPTMFGAGPSDIYSDAGPGSSLDLDTDRPIFGEDPYREDNKAAGNGGLLPDPDQKQGPLSYDDLRRKNRGDYSEARQDPYRYPTVRPLQHWRRHAWTASASWASILCGLLRVVHPHVCNPENPVVLEILRNFFTCFSYEYIIDPSAVPPISRAPAPPAAPPAPTNKYGDIMD